MPFDATISAATGLRQFLRDQQPALLDAAKLLGGQAAARRFRAAAEGPAYRILREAAALHDLLTLQHVGIPDSIEAACFAEISPADPRVDGICRLAEALEDHLAACTAARPGTRAA